MSVRTYKNGAWQDIASLKAVKNGVYADVPSAKIDVGGVKKEVWPNELRLNYGDGSKNLIQDGYSSILRAYDYEAKSYKNSDFFQARNTYSYGNFDRWLWGDKCINSPNQEPLKVSSGGHYYYNTETTGGGQDSFTAYFKGGNLTGYWELSNFAVQMKTPSGTNVSGTLKYLADNGIIEPMVIIHSESWSNSYIFKNVINMYTGGVVSGSYAIAVMTFMPKKGYKVVSVYISASKNSAGDYDGYYAYYYPNIRFCL